MGVGGSPVRLLHCGRVRPKGTGPAVVVAGSQVREEQGNGVVLKEVAAGPEVA
jgi:hypothetical protein